MEQEYRLEALHVTKHFGGVRALTDATLQVRPGEVHALMGENGAGKSTLMKILSGAHARDSGELRMDGEPLEVHGPKSAIDQGIAVIYQEFVLAPDLSVAENIFIDSMNDGHAFISWRRLRESARAQLAQLGFEDIDPKEEIGRLPVAHQQVVEICKCLARHSRVLVLDEPTAVLTFAETEKLFTVIRRLREDGVSIIYISHRLDEVFEISDRITVLKDGAHVGTVETSQITKDQLVHMMVGRELRQLYPPRDATIGEVVLRVENLSSGTAVQNLDLEVRAGEVVGLSGLVGAGRSEAMKVIFGAGHRDAGRVTFHGRPGFFRSPKEAVRQGFGFLPEDRKNEGLVLDQSIRMNLTLASLHKYTGPFGLIHRSKERQVVRETLQSIGTKYSSIEDDASSLSGGNQQKLVLGKWILADCDCIVFDEPTRGVDIGAKTEIYRMINELAARGVAVILISSEMTEVIGMCDRVLVMRRGALAGEVSGAQLNEDNLIRLSMGVE